jgi:Bacterial Ig-like domain (group 2)
MIVHPSRLVLVLSMAMTIATALWNAGCTGVAEPTPSLAVTPNALSVSAKIGNSSSEVVSLTNISSNDVSLQQAILNGANFSVSGLTTPTTLSAGQSRTFSVKFSATTAGNFNGSLAIMTDPQHRPVMLALHGNGSNTNPAVGSVAVTPSVVSLAPNSTATFSATVHGAATNTNVIWSASLGSITQSGVYTSPSGKAVGTVTATSVADPTKSASALVMVAGSPVGNPTPDPPTSPVSSVSVTPSVTSLAPGGNVSFTASVQGTTSNKAVSWACSTGTITQSGVYNAPSTAGMAFVTATSVADPTKTATATVTVISGPSSPQNPIVTSVTVTPATASAATGGSLSFTASVQGSTSNKSVTWKALLGTITTGGQYTAPAKAGTDIVTATSVADPTKTGAATVTVTGGPTSPTGPAVTSVTVSPSTASSVTTGTLSFSASVQGSTSNKSVTWRALLGTITSGGQYSAPAKAGTDTVTATSVADPSVSGAASVNVTAATQPPVVTSISVSPTSTSVNTGASAQFTATVQGTVSDKSVTWSAVLGTITSSGAYTAPSKAGNDTVTATSNADSTKSSSATVSVTAAPTKPAQNVSCTGSNCPAFAGVGGTAEGGGAASVGGRGGVVYEVTNLNDSGTGSLRACVQASGPRTCIFRVSGLITNLSPLQISNPYITIAGQTAPGGGIVLGGYNQNGQDLYITTHDVIVRYVTVDGNSPKPTGPDTGTVGFEIGSSANNVVLDHTSCRWAGNKCYVSYTSNTDIGSAITNTSYQWSMLYEPNVNHPVGPMLDTASFNNDQVNQDLHHDLFMNIGHRIPLDNVSRATFQDNIVYNWCDPNAEYGWATEPAGGNELDLISNKYVAGNMNASCSNPHPVNVNANYSLDCTSNCDMSGSPSIHMSGNIGPQGTDYELSCEVSSEGGAEVSCPISSSWQRSSPLPAKPYPITNDSASNLDSLIIPTVGNSQHLDCNGNFVMNRDSQDTRIINQYIARGPGGLFAGSTYTGPMSSPAVPGGTACVESMHDGIPDQWKVSKGLSTTDSTLYRTTAPNGYTYLENYLNGAN